MKRIITVLLGFLLLAVPTAHATTYALGTPAILVGPAASSSSVVLAVSPPTGVWTASTNAAWLHLADSFQSGTGSTNVIFSFDANPGATRAGTLTIAGQTLTITQAGSTYIAGQTMNTLVSSGLNQPRGVAVDNAGNVFIADSSNNAIKKWTPTNHALATLVSSGLNGPYSVAVDGPGNVYIADTGNTAIKEWIAASSTVTTLVSTGLYAPSGVAVDGAGNVYIADGRADVVFEWTVANSNLITLNPNPPNMICYPPGVAVDIAGNVYFDDTCGDVLNEWTALSSNIVTLTPGWFYHPTGVAVDGSGNVFIADQADNWIWEWSAADSSLTTPVSGFNRPGGVAVDGSGNLYIADTANNAIEEWAQFFMDPTPKREGLAAGNDSLPPILPAPATQLASFAPVSNQPWLTITGVTNGIVYFSFTTTATNRTGTITIFGQNFPITQNGSSVALGVTAVLAGPAAGSNSVVLAVSPNSNTWTATANAAWLHLSPASQSGSGSTIVIFSFDANSGATRSGTLTIAGQTLTVTQAGSTYVPATSATTLASLGSTFFTDGISVDGAGNVYIAIADQNKIMKWTAANNAVTTLVSSGIMYPTETAVDSAGNVYFNGAGIEKWTAANGSVTALMSSNPNEFALDIAGNIYFSSGNSIQVWTAANNTLNTVVSGLNGPSALTVDIAGNIYFNSGDGFEVWSAASNTVTYLASPDFTIQEDIAVDGEGNIYLAGDNLYFSRKSILKWNAVNNTLTTVISSGQAEYFGVTVDGAGNLYFTDAYDGLLQEMPNAFLDPTSRTEGLAGGNDSLPPVLPATINLRAPFAPSSDSAWLTITGVTNGVVSYSFPTNFSLTRTGHITLLGQSISITQLGPAFTLGTTNLYEGPAAGSDSVVLAVTPNIGIWTATTNVPWLHLSPANLSGTGSTNVIFSFDANPGATRSGTLTIAGQTLTVTQAGSTYVAANPMTTLVSSGLFLPFGVAVDGAGNVFIADTFHNAIKKWMVASNTVVTLVSSGLNSPIGVAVDSAGNVYIADYDNNAIKEWSAASNTVTTLVASGLDLPAGVAVDGAGNVYIADTGNNAIKKWTAASNTVTTLVASGLNGPLGVAVDGAGNVYIADYDNNAIKKWSAASNTVTTLVVSGLDLPAGVAVDGAGNVYIADTGNNAIKKWTAASNTVTTLVASGLNGPLGVAVDGVGNAYIADTYNNAIEELPHAFVDPTARLETADAGNGALPAVLPATENLLAPFAPSSDSSWLTITGVTNGVVNFSFTANFGSSRTANIILLGQTIPVTQGGPTYSLGANALLVGPLAGSNSVVLGVAPKSAAWTATANATWLHLGAANQSGTGSTNIIFSFDANTGATRSGTLSIAGQTLTVTQAGSTYVSAGLVGVLVSSGLSSPYGVAVDGAGNVYVADSSHNVIKEWTPANNNVTTLVSSGLSNPHGVAVDGAGNVYIADTFNNAIKEWTVTNSNVTTLVSSGLSSPYGVAVDSAGNVYIADTFNNAIKEWTPANNSVTTLVSSGLSSPRGVAVDGAGNVYIADTSHNAIKEWTPVNNNVTTLVSSGLSSPYGVAVDGAGNVYIADTYDNAIKELPHAFVDPTAKLEGLAAGNDALPVVLPATANLLIPFAPTSDQTWLTIAGITNGVVSFGFTANTGPARTAHISLLGQTISITQGLIGTPPNLTGVQMLANGAIQFSFTNNPSASFTVLSTTNISLPLANWTVVGSATNISSDLFQFTSQPTTNDRQRYYRVRSP